MNIFLEKQIIDAKNNGITSLSQNDKRIRFAKISSELLIKTIANEWEY